MNPFDPALLERLCAEAAPPPAPSSTPAPNGWRSSVYAEAQPAGCLPRWKADWEVTDADGLAEWLELADLSDLTAVLGSWEAARTLFAPEPPCAGLYATQTPPERPSRVSVSPDVHKPAQPLP